MPAPDLRTTGLADELALLAAAAREAGDIAMRYFRREPEVWMKAGQSPVSAADIAVDEFLRDTLLHARPDYGWLSEETADTPERLSASRTFVVDPIDGTRAFIEGRNTWCVSVAIVEAGVSLAGVLDCPARRETFQAVAGGTATRNGEQIRVSDATNPPVIAGPKAMLDLVPHMAGGRPVSYIPSLAYRIAMVAAGEIDATFIKPNSHDWDLAAADLILRQAGGELLQPDGTRPAYAGAQVRHGPLVAGSGALVREMSTAVARAYH